MARSLNRAQLIGNLTRDPELRYTPNGSAVCTFAIATNRTWTKDSGEKVEEVDFHRIVAWNKLAELCSQFLVKGRKIYVEGRISNRTWQAQDGQQKNTTEIVIDDMILLDNKHNGESTQTDKPTSTQEEPTEPVQEEIKEPVEKPKKTAKKSEEESDVPDAGAGNEGDVDPEDIPF